MKFLDRKRDVLDIINTLLGLALLIVAIYALSSPIPTLNKNVQLLKDSIEGSLKIGTCHKSDDSLGEGDICIGDDVFLGDDLFISGDFYLRNRNTGTWFKCEVNNGSMNCKKRF